MKCLSREPIGRYRTAKELAEDLNNFKMGMPIVARPLGTVESATKWVKRNKGVSGAGLAVAVALLVGTGVSLWYADRACAEAEIARREKSRADELATEYQQETVKVREEKTRADELGKQIAAELKESRHRLDLSRLKEAPSYFESNLVQLARDTLNEIAPENRCVAWRILNRRFDGSLFALWGHTAGVASVAVSADGGRIVTGSGDKTARVWDAQSGASLLELKGHTGPVTSVVVSADCRRIVTGSQDITARVWEAQDVASGDPRIPDEELARRQRLARPDPAWHAGLRAQYEKEKDPFAASMQHSFEHRARGVLAVQNCAFDKALGHFLTAELLKPKPAK